MKTKLLAITLFTLTLGAVVYYPQLFATTSVVQTPVNHHITVSTPTTNKPRVDVVFVLDTATAGYRFPCRYHGQHGRPHSDRQG